MTFELIAQNSQTGQKIVERFLDDGTRFMKVVPFNPQIYVKLKEQFKGKNILIEISASKWIKISKIGENPELKSAAKQAIGEKEVTQDLIMNMEADMLRKAGFIVQVEEMQDAESN